MERQREYFAAPTNGVLRCCVTRAPEQLCRQERDWSCAVACIRTITNSPKTETEIVEEFNLTPGPHYSSELTTCGIIDTKLFDIRTNVDTPNESTIDELIEMMDDGYSIMVEWLISQEHWTVVLGYYVVGDPTDAEQHVFLMYDPYYDKVRLVNADEFRGMWFTYDSREYGLYIAVKPKEK